MYVIFNEYEYYSYTTYMSWVLWDVGFTNNTNKRYVWAGTSKNIKTHYSIRLVQIGNICFLSCLKMWSYYLSVILYGKNNL